MISDEAVERLYLNKVLLDPKYSTILFEYFDERFFTNSNIQTIVKTINSYYSNYKKIPSKQVIELLLEKIAEKKELSNKELKQELNLSLDLKIKQDEEFVEKNILDFIKGKSTYFTIMDNLDKIKVNKDVSSCMDKFNNITGISFDNKDGMNYFNDLDIHFEELARPEILMPTGFTELDKAFNGGVPIDGRCLTIFMGQTNIGKSLILSNLAVNLLKEGKFVIIFSMEMSEFVYSKRIDAHLANYNVNALHKDIPKVKNKIQTFKTAHPDAQLLIKEYPPRTVNANTFKNFIDDIILKYKRKPDAILVDYLNIMNPINAVAAKSNSYERVGAITQEVRALSYIYECACFSITQSNRASYDSNDVDLEHVSDSTQIAMTADAIVSMWQADGDKEANRLNFKVIKSRFGMVGLTFPLFIDYNSLRIKDYDCELLDEESEEKNVGKDLLNLLK